MYVLVKVESLREFVRDARGRRSEGELIGEAFEAHSLVVLYFSAAGLSGLAILGRIPRI